VTSVAVYRVKDMVHTRMFVAGITHFAGLERKRSRSLRLIED
jgi:hypothetical protein